MKVLSIIGIFTVCFFVFYIQIWAYVSVHNFIPKIVEGCWDIILADMIFFIQLSLITALTLQSLINLKNE